MDSVYVDAYMDGDDSVLDVSLEARARGCSLKLNACWSEWYEG